MAGLEVRNFSAPDETRAPDKTKVDVVRVPDGDATDVVAVDEPLEIRIDGRPVAVTMRTPGHDEELAIGFALYLPFVAIDLAVSAMLMGLGMMMLSPPVVSLPVKLLLFVMVDGWGLITTALVGSYTGSG